MAVYGPIPCQVETVFLVFHHYALPFSTAVSSPFEILTVSLGVYSSLHAAQSVAVSALHLCLKQLQSIGISGKFCKDIDLQHRGLITQIIEGGKERPLSEYEIRAVPLNDCYSEEVRVPGRQFKQLVEPGLVVALPPREPPNKTFDEEQDPLWAQTRIPYFRKRDDAPFRNLQDPPYSTEFVLKVCKTAALWKAATRLGARKNDGEEDIAKLWQQKLRPDPVAGSCRVDLQDEESHEADTLVEKTACSSTKTAGNSSAGNTLGDDGDIGPIYRGHRHSISS